MATVKRLLVWGAVFALLGVVGATSITPSLVGWYNTPGQSVAMCDCKELARTTAATIVQAQLAGLGSGFIIGLILGTVVTIRSRRAAAEAVAAATAAPVAPAAAAPTSETPPAAPPPPAAG